MTEQCVQETYAPKSICFGCGPANSKGLRIRSFPSNDETGDFLVAEWTPEKHHEAFQGILNGGIIGAVLDCHSNWAAAYFLMKRDQLTEAPSTVTADFHVTLKRPTPTDAPIRLVARISRLEGPKAVVEATLECKGKICATCKGTFVAVQPGHPAYHRWI